MEIRRNGDGHKIDKAALAARMRSIREEIYGDGGDSEVAKRLGVPLRTWINYENGVTIPGEMILQFLVLTGVNPLWLLEGEGVKYRTTTRHHPEKMRR